MTQRWKIVSFVLVGLLCSQTLWGHQIWIDSHAHQGKVKVSAGFGHGSRWDAHLNERIQQTKYFTLTPGSEPKPLDLSVSDEIYQTEIKAEPPLAVFGVCHYGYVDFKGPHPFDLHYYAKRIHAAPEQWSKFSPRKQLTVEIMPQMQGNKLVLSVLRQGKPLPHAKLSYSNSFSEEAVELESDEKGQVAVDDLQSGDYYFYVMHKVPGEGKIGDKKFDFTYQIATLSLTLTNTDLGAE